MAQPPFHSIGLIGREGVPGVTQTLQALNQHLRTQACQITLLTPETAPKDLDLLIVVGGDGSLLNAAHLAIDHDLPVLGINRGRLGFLTDIHPKDLSEVDAILKGHYHIETRSLLQVTLKRGKTIITQKPALNDAVLLPGDVAQMIEFDVFINQQLVCHHRADGMIVATPTGSTAYALSGGGPILHPDLAAVVLVPMFPHTLSSRPIVVSNESCITLTISNNNEKYPYFSCDGLERTQTEPGDEIILKKHPNRLQLVHPLNYQYFYTLREKLHWEKQATREDA